MVRQVINSTALRSGTAGSGGEHFFYVRNILAVTVVAPWIARA